jgi:hypothetical protein
MLRIYTRPQQHPRAALHVLGQAVGAADEERRFAFQERRELLGGQVFPLFIEDDPGLFLLRKLLHCNPLHRIAARHAPRVLGASLLRPAGQLSGDGEDAQP